MVWCRYIDDQFFIWEHGQESPRVIIDQFNLFHPKIKFTAKYSKQEANFLDLNIKLIDGELKADLFVKPADTHQLLDPTSSHPYHCKKGITYSQALRLNRICSDNANFDQSCNDLKKWLMERKYEDKKMSKQILRACEHSRNDPLERDQNVRAIMEELHILVTPDKDHTKVFPNVPVVGFRNGISHEHGTNKFALI